MFGIGFFEIVIIAVVALVFVGPKRLPEVARQAGRFFVQFKRITSDVRSSVDNFVRDAEDQIRKEERDALQKLLSAEAPAQPAQPAQPAATSPSPYNVAPEDPLHHQHHIDAHHDENGQTVVQTPAQDQGSDLTPPGSVPSQNRDPQI